MKTLALAIILLSNSMVFANDLKYCDKTYKISESETFYGCEVCMETDSGACVYTKATCYKVTNSEKGDIKEQVDCAPHTCGRVPTNCSILYTGIEELQSLEGQTVKCLNNTQQICQKQKWHPYVGN